jgi:hypothetical protein
MLVANQNSACGGSEGQQSSNDIPGEELVGEVGVDAPNTRNWYPQDSMEIDAMLAQELGLLVTGPELQRIQVFPTTYCNFHGDDAARPSVCQKANRMLQGLQGFFGTQVDFPSEMDFRPTEVLSLRTFLEQDVPTFPFSRSPEVLAQ